MCVDMSEDMCVGSISLCFHHEEGNCEDVCLPLLEYCTLYACIEIILQQHDSTFLSVS